MVNKEIIQENKAEITSAYYLYSEEQNYCEYVEELASGEVLNYPLEIVSELSFKTVFSQTSYNQEYHPNNPLYLTIERTGSHLEITLDQVQDNIPAITSTYFSDWGKIDWGKMVWNPEIEDYQLVKGLPKSFYLFFEDYQLFEGEDGAIQFSFNFENHLVLKDKDPNKNHIWYHFDYNWPLGWFIYDTLTPHIPKEDKKEVVIIPGELGMVGDVFEDEYNIHNYYKHSWPEKKDPAEDFYWESRNDWVEKYGEPALVISFLPTHEDNWKLENQLKLTGTRWFKKLYEVFVEPGTPLVLKCYPGFIHTNLLKRFPEIFKKIDNIVELPLQINGKFTGTGNQLVFFNCPWIKGRKLNFNEYLETKYQDREDKVLEPMINPEQIHQAPKNKN